MMLGGEFWQQTKKYIMFQAKLVFCLNKKKTHTNVFQLHRIYLFIYFTFLCILACYFSINIMLVKQAVS